MAPAGGSSDWFMRPSNATISAAVVFAGNNEMAMIRVLEGEATFGDALNTSVVNGWLSGESSVFTLST